MTEAERNLLRLTAALAGILLGREAGGISESDLLANARQIRDELRAAFEKVRAEGSPGSQPPSSIAIFS